MQRDTARCAFCLRMGDSDGDAQSDSAMPRDASAATPPNLLLDLPAEVLLSLLETTDAADAVAVSAVNRQLASVSSEHRQLLWRSLTVRRWPSAASVEPGCWRSRYKLLHGTARAKRVTCWRKRLGRTGTAMPCCCFPPATVL